MKTRGSFETGVRLGAGTLLALALGGFATAQVTSRVSLNSSGVQGDGGGDAASITPDGRFVAFTSWSSNLAAGDTNGTSDVFVRDRQTGTTERVSVHTSGAEGDGNTLNTPAISADGRYVAFESDATNLVTGDTNGVYDIFVRDRLNGTTERVSIDSSEAEGDDASISVAISDDGRYVAFLSYATNLVASDTNGIDAFVRDRQSGTTERVSVDSSEAEADSDCRGLVSISSDGRYVAFASFATNLVAGDTNGQPDGFVRDRQNGTTERVSVSSGGVQGNDISAEFDISISADGRYVAFPSRASNLVAGDTNGTYDVYVRDRVGATTERVSVHSSGAQGTGGFSYYTAISGDGRYVAFTSTATNLVAGDTNARGDTFCRDRQSGTTERISIATSGTQGNDDSGYYDISISQDGRYVVFGSLASNLVTGDTNSSDDVFLRDREPEIMTSLCDPGVAGVLACPCSNAPSGSGRGCDNSSDTGGASLSTAGVPDLSSDTLVFTTSGQIPATLSILVQGDALASSGARYGRGVRCAGGVLRTLYTKTASGGSIMAPDFGAGDPTVSARSAAVGDALTAGQTRWYFVGYRDPIAVCPASFAGTPRQTFNATQTWQVNWQP